MTPEQKLAIIEAILNKWRDNTEADDGDPNFADDHYAIEAIDNFLYQPDENMTRLQRDGWITQETAR